MKKKCENFLNKKNEKISKPELAFKGFASNNNVEILNYFNCELQLKDTEIKSKLIELLTQWKGFKFVTTLVLVFKRIGREDEKSLAIFIQAQKQK